MMKLENLLAITNENTNVYIHQNGEMVSFYDGRNSIDTIYNNNEIITVWTNQDGLHIEIVL